MKKENDLGRDEIGALVWRTALPSMLAQFVSVLYSIVDRMYIGHIAGVGETALAGVGAIMWGMKYTRISPTIGAMPGIKAFVAAVFGGIGSIPGAMLGGILLGAGGLVRAYAQGSKTALDAAGVVVMEKSARQLIEVDYSTWQRLEYFLRSAPVIIEHTEFGASVVCTLMVRVRDEEILLADITRVTDGKAETLEDGTLFYPWPD